MYGVYRVCRVCGVYRVISVYGLGFRIGGLGFKGLVITIVGFVGLPLKGAQGCVGWRL